MFGIGMRRLRRLLSSGGATTSKQSRGLGPEDQWLYSFSLTSFFPRVFLVKGFLMRRPVQHIKARSLCTLFLDWFFSTGFFLAMFLISHGHYVVMYKGDCCKYKSMDITK